MDKASIRVSGVSNQSSGYRGQRFLAFVFTIIALNFTMWFATYINAHDNLADQVILFECVIGGTVVLGRSAVYVSEAWATARKK